MTRLYRTYLLLKKTFPKPLLILLTLQTANVVIFTVNKVCTFDRYYHVYQVPRQKFCDLKN